MTPIRDPARCPEQRAPSLGVESGPPSESWLTQVGDLRSGVTSMTDDQCDWPSLVRHFAEVVLPIDISRPSPIA